MIDWQTANLALRAHRDAINEGHRQRQAAEARAQHAIWSADAQMRAAALHASDCSLHNAPALPVGPCDCWVAASPLPPVDRRRQALAALARDGRE